MINSLDNLNESRKYLEQRISLLEETEEVKNYLELKSLLKETNTSYEEAFTSSKNTDYSSCKHLFAIYDEDYDYYEGRGSYEYGCLKCGLNSYVYNHRETIPLSLEDKAVISYLKRLKFNPFYNNTKLYFNTHDEFKKACNLYYSFKERNKDASDEMIFDMIKEFFKKGKEKVKND